MKSIKGHLIASFALLLLNSSCALPIAMLGFIQEGQSEIEMAQNADVEEIEKNYTIGIFIDAGDKVQDYLYAGEYNPIRIIVPEGMNASDIELICSAGKIERTETDPTLFRLFVKEPNLAVEITALDKISGQKGYLMTETIFIPVPEVQLHGEENGQIDIEKFKKQGQLVIVQADNEFLCMCNAFTLTRISAEGQRTSVLNKSDAFSDETKLLMSKAQKGDIYIFDDIKISCPGYTMDKMAKNLVYVFK